MIDDSGSTLYLPTAVTVVFTGTAMLQTFSFYHYHPVTLTWNFGEAFYPVVDYSDLPPFCFSYQTLHTLLNMLSPSLLIIL